MDRASPALFWTDGGYHILIFEVWLAVLLGFYEHVADKSVEHLRNQFVALSVTAFEFSQA